MASGLDRVGQVTVWGDQCIGTELHTGKWLHLCILCSVYFTTVKNWKENLYWAHSVLSRKSYIRQFSVS